VDRRSRTRRVGGQETPFGWVPKAGDLDLSGLDIPRRRWTKPPTSTRRSGKQELTEEGEFFEMLGKASPKRFSSSASCCCRACTDERGRLAMTAPPGGSSSSTRTTSASGARSPPMATRKPRRWGAFSACPRARGTRRRLRSRAVSLPLARLGARVLGVDQSAPLLAEAERSEARSISSSCATCDTTSGRRSSSPPSMSRSASSARSATVTSPTTRRSWERSLPR
jgi:hypothetical protein